MKKGNLNRILDKKKQIYICLWSKLDFLFRKSPTVHHAHSHQMQDAVYDGVLMYATWSMVETADAE